jgi:hypothetical protein
MNTVERIDWARAGRGAGDDVAARAPMGLEAMILLVVIAGQLLGLATHVLLGDALTLLVAAAMTLGRMRAEVRALSAPD